MDEIVPNQNDEFEEADLICGDCTGNLVQIEIPKEKPIFTFSAYVKWMYQCQKCGKNSKTFTSKKSNKTQ